MSDDFDRQAEREKLREKYERDQAKREASERMSELLLQGATMTNRHCPECQSPVFTYEGTAFCPTCEREITEDSEAERSEASERASGGSGAASSEAVRREASNRASGERERPASSEAERSEADAEPAADDVDAAGRSAANGDSATAGGADDATPAANSDAAPSAGPDAGEEPAPEETRPATTPERRPARVDPPARREDAGGDRREERRGLADAEAALVREITNLTRRAEETRDVSRKRDFFAAAREAAETLETVRRL
jgi:uncharacterized Zn finger protein (UPF0148 family)